MSFAKCFILLTFALLTLTACGTTREARAIHTIPSSNDVIDPPDEVAFNAIKAYLAMNHEPAYSQYEYTRADLDGDGRREAIVMFESPFYSWCNSDGCKMVIFRAANDHFSVLSEIAPVRGPLLVSDTRTDGWHDIVVHISGRNDLQTKDVALKFNGTSYPSRPEFAPALPSLIAMANINGTQIFP